MIGTTGEGKNRSDRKTTHYTEFNHCIEHDYTNECNSVGYLHNHFLILSRVMELLFTIFIPLLVFYY